MMSDRTIGSFRVGELLIRDNPHLIARVFSMMDLVVVRAEHLFASRVIEYVALSSMFGHVDDFREPPLYDVRVSTVDGMSISEVQCDVVEKDRFWKGSLFIQMVDPE